MPATTRGRHSATARASAGEPLADAAKSVLDEVKALGGDGGLIAVSADGQVVTPYNSKGMNRAVLHADGSVTAEVF